MIRLEKIVFGYGSMHKLFDGLSLTLLPGHIHGLLGVNGTGKTTLLKLASGLLFPSQGTVRVGGLDAAHREAAFYRELFFRPGRVRPAGDHPATLRGGERAVLS